jgi:long-chain acyl-CoA synthetase
VKNDARGPHVLDGGVGVDDAASASRPSPAPPATRTLPGLLVARARATPDGVALREKEFGVWQEITWTGYLDRVRRFSLGLRSLGVVPGDTVAIIGDNRPEWVIAELAAQALGAVPVGIYQDSVLDELKYVLEASGARVVVAEDQEQVDKVLDLQEQLPTLERIIYHDAKGLGAYEAGHLLFFPIVEELGEALDREQPGLFDATLRALDSNGVALLCTTSGTTSTPKLAMLSHTNLISMAEQLQQVDPMVAEDDVVSFLPLAWIGEQMVTLSWALVVGFTIDFPEDSATVRRDLREIGPKAIISPPRIWESMVSEVQVKMEDSTPLKRRLYDWSMSVGRAMADTRFDGRVASRGLVWKHRLANALTLLPLKDQLGLRQVRRAYTGGAALGPDVFRFFHAMGVNLKQLYGQTEVSGLSVVHRDGDVRFQTVGRPLPGTEVKIAENGEILTRSPAVFMGYHGDKEATAEALEDGWLRSGDAGYMDDHGHLVVIDRAKDVMTLADGTTFSPQFIENQLKFSPYVREAVVFGGDWPFVTALVAIDYENAGKWAERHQVAYTTFTDLAQKSEIYALVTDHLTEVNATLPAAARIRRFLLLHKQLDADDAELTRTRKVRRRFIAERYAELVEALYGDGDRLDVETEIAYQDGRTATVRHELRIETVGWAPDIPEAP